MAIQDLELAKKYLNSGMIKIRNCEVISAIEDYTKTIELIPDYADSFYFRIIAWLQLGEEEEAKFDMSAASRFGVNINTTINVLLDQYDRVWKTLGNSENILQYQKFCILLNNMYPVSI